MAGSAPTSSSVRSFTAGQGVSPRAAYQNARHASMSERATPQSGGDRYGNKGERMPGNGETNRLDNMKRGATSKAGIRSVVGVRLPKAPAYQNAEHAVGRSVRGNSEGRSEVAHNTVTDTVSRRAKARIERVADIQPKLTKEGTRKAGDHPARIERERLTFGPRAPVGWR